MHLITLILYDSQDDQVNQVLKSLPQRGPFGAC